MALLTAGSLGKMHGTKALFDGVTLEVVESARIGLIGPNGCGKTSLLRLLAGLDKEFDGTLSVSGGLRIGYLEQELNLADEMTAFDAILQAAESLAQMEAEMAELHRALAEPDVTIDNSRRMMARLADLQHRFESQDGYGIERRAERIMVGLGLPEILRDQPLSSLSGGERSRVALARLLLMEPDLWLMDEPTNHLDIDGIVFLEKFLAQSKAAAVIVSHDRTLLDNVTNETWEIENKKLLDYPAAYTRSREIRAERILSQKRAYEKQRVFIEHEEEYIRRYGAGQRAKEARGRKKRLVRLARIERPDERERVLSLQFPEAKRLGNVVLETENLAMSYTDKPLFSKLAFNVEPGETLAVVGPNGMGKTTLVEVLLGTMKPTAGKVLWGETVDIGVMRQYQEFPDVTMTPLDFVRSVGTRRTELELRNLLGAMLFSGSEVDKPISVLSGGEQKRLMFTKLLMESHNVLILDEPTNHLDIASSEALELALSVFEGTLLVVSHDRRFIDEIADKTLWMENGECWLTNGGFTEAYAARMKRQSEAQAEKAVEEPKKVRARRKSESPKKRKGPYSRLTTEQIEARIIEAEERIEELNNEFTKPEVFTNPEELKKVKTAIDSAKSELRLLEDEYSGREA